MQLQRGQRVSLTEVATATNIAVGLDLHGIAVDVSCFGLDANGHLADERDMTFFNQPRTPCGGVQLERPAGFATGFLLALERLPPTVDRLVLVAAIDGDDSWPSTICMN